ncbi:DUF981 family protein [Virgibacillus halodenitrificans]|uniref:DUF981 family protein n=1 Tax=Virgibacillus halodenitrificans TaxID=1482 RepID=A0ABR7VPG5_VIRHA|nr:DUF981 family protein [Virgibacillus halodenitrificans]MBD1222427.1 DUF981 family protein [Virgibacillus halodenitrificans]MCG1027674.1 DUF981 family protein [Virgibacillus halodenitrificans]
MTIDWAATQVYNTIMCVAAGVGLLLILRFLKRLRQNKIGQLEGWAMGFGVLGFILVLTGAHMSLTWPLAEIGFPFDDIIFGEPSLAFGVLLFAAAILLWRKSNVYMKQGINPKDRKAVSEQLKGDLPDLMKPMSYFGAAMGLALIAIGIAGVTYQLFAAPPQEPISGAFAEYPMVEAIFISTLYALTGIGAFLFTFTLKLKPAKWMLRVSYSCMYVSGLLLTAFGIMNYFTHIGLIVNTM